MARVWSGADISDTQQHLTLLLWEWESPSGPREDGQQSNFVFISRPRLTCTHLTFTNATHKIQTAMLCKNWELEQSRDSFSFPNLLSLIMITMLPCGIVYLKCRCPPWSVSGWWRLDPWAPHPMSSPAPVSPTSWSSILVSTCHLSHCCHVLATGV